MADQLLSPSFVFRYSVPVRATDSRWLKSGVELGEEYLLPCFQELDGRPPYASVKAAWSQQGLFFDVEVSGKKQLPWCRPTRIEDSDSIQLWIDTRDTHNVHRATRFCHRFLLMPAGGGSENDKPLSTMLKINRAREESRSLNAEPIPVVSKVTSNGYRLQALLGAQTLSGFDPEQQPRLGFSYLITDQELGPQCFSVGTEFPFVEDPSLWGTISLE